MTIIEEISQELREMRNMIRSINDLMCQHEWTRQGYTYASGNADAICKKCGVKTMVSAQLLDKQ